MKNTVAIEKTSKGYKLRLAICALLFWLGVPIYAIVCYSKADIKDTSADYTGPAVLALFCVVWYLVTKLRIWWNHG